jgi:hypothetical protein
MGCQPHIQGIAGGNVYTRKPRELKQNVWCQARTAVNNREPVVIFCRALIEARGRFPFEIRGLTVGNKWLSFYIKPADGYQLPKITRWMMNISSLSRRSRRGSM